MVINPDHSSYVSYILLCSGRTPTTRSFRQTACSWRRPSLCNIQFFFFPRSHFTFAVQMRRGNGKEWQEQFQASCAFIHSIRAQGLTPEYRQNVISTGSILIMTNSSGNSISIQDINVFHYLLRLGLIN
jgi:hypothetical protein